MQTPQVQSALSYQEQTNAWHFGTHRTWYIFPRAFWHCWLGDGNGDGGCRRQLPKTGGLTAQVMWLGLTVGGRLALLYIHQMNRVNSRNDLCYDDSTINIVLGVIIIITIIKGIWPERTCISNPQRFMLGRALQDPAKPEWSPTKICPLNKSRFQAVVVV